MRRKRERAIKENGIINSSYNRSDSENVNDMVKRIPVNKPYTINGVDNGHCLREKRGKKRKIYYN